MLFHFKSLGSLIEFLGTSCQGETGINAVNIISFSLLESNILDIEVVCWLEGGGVGGRSSTAGGITRVSLVTTAMWFRKPWLYLTQ
jgi:hypothetical protein